MNATRFRLALLGVLGLVAVFFLILVPAFPQATAYHNFADQRPLLGVPHSLNVLSNIPFVIFGLLGIVYLLRPAVWNDAALFVAPWQR